MAIKRQQCDMVMRLYFRAVADASVVVASRLVSLWDKRRLLETGGRFCQSSKEVLWLQYSVSPASDHLSCVDPVNFPQWWYICIALARFKYSLDNLGDVCLIPRYVGHINGQMFCDCSWFQHFVQCFFFSSMGITIFCFLFMAHFGMFYTWVGDLNGAIPWSKTFPLHCDWIPKTFDILKLFSTTFSHITHSVIFYVQLWKIDVCLLCTQIEGRLVWHSMMKSMRVIYAINALKTDVSP